MRAWMLVTCLLLASGCTKRNPAYCDEDSPCTGEDAPFCDLGEYGHPNTCIPDPRPPDAGVSDPPDAQTSPISLEVTLAGAGAGSVYSAQPGIDCGDLCSAQFAEPTPVELLASPAVGTTFLTWGGACSEGFGDCQLLVDREVAVTARFELEGAHLGSRAIGGSGSERGVAVSFDGLGNIVVAGTFDDAVDFGDGNPLIPTGTESFVAKYGPDLMLVWVEPIAASAKAVTVDDDGDAYYVGETASGMVLTRLSGDTGARAWSVEVAGAITVGGVAVGGGRLVVVGGFEGSVDFGAGNLIAAMSDVFVAWYTPGGDLVRAYDYGGSSSDVAISVDVDDTGRALVGGVVGGPTSFGGPVLPATSSSSGFVVQFSPSGTHQWSRSHTSDGTFAVVSAVAFGDAGDAYAAGMFTGNVDFGGGDTSAGAVSAMSLVRYDVADGTYRWADVASALGQYCTMILCLPSRVIPRSVAIDGRGRVVVGGEFIGSADFGAGSQASYGGKDVFTAWYESSSGAHVRSPVYGRMEEPATAQFELFGRMLAVDRLGQVAITGLLPGDLGFGGPVLHPDGQDAFLVEFGP